MYIPRNILLTGGAGFIGSHVVRLLVKNYPNLMIINLDKLDYCSDLRNLEDIKNYKNYKFIKGDICNSELISYLIDTENIDTIMHFAAQTHVDNSFGNSFTFTHNNVMGTHVLLEASKGKIRRFIHVSTDEVYDYFNNEEIARNENDKLGPTNPYAASKAGAEMIVKSYYHSFGLPIIITRGNNVYGPGQYPEKIIPRFINQLARAKKITIHGNGSTLRNFLYVEDVARAFEKILFKGIIGEVYNIGGTNEMSVLDVAHKILNRFEKDESDLLFVPDRPFNDPRYHIDSEKLKSLGWSEQVSWDEGFEETFRWYINNLTRYEEKMF